MRTQLLNALIGTLLMAVTVAAAPALSAYGSSDVCDPTTIFITISSLSTITESAPTVYVTLYGTPSSTLTRTLTTSSLPQVETVYFTAPLASTNQGEDEATTQAPQVTITETTVVLITSVQTATSNGFFGFVVVNGTTEWLGGQTPTGSYVVQTSVVTVLPVPADSTTTLQTTIHSTHPITLTATLSISSPTSLTSGAVGTGSSFAGMGPGGWNTTSLSSYAAHTGFIGTGGLTLASDPGAPLTFATTFSIDTTQSLAAQSGFNVFSTSSDDGTLSTPVPHGSAPGSLSTAATSSTKGQRTTPAPSPHASTSAPCGSQVGWTDNTIGDFSTPVPCDVSTPTPYGSVPALTSTGTFLTPVPTSLTKSASSASRVFTSPVPPYANSTSSRGSYSFPTGTHSGTAASTGTGVPTNAITVVWGSTGGTAVWGASPTSSFVWSSTGSSAQASNTTTRSGTASNQTSTSVSSAASATPTKCGEVGDFTLNFDDIPPLSISNSTDPNTVTPEPVFNPYHQFDFSDGFTVVPPPKGPYLPSSPPLFVEFIPNFNINGTNPMAGPNTLEYGYSGDIGNGDHGLTGCFSFNAYGASFGCDSTGPACNFHFMGFKYDRTTRNTTAVASQSITVPACSRLNNCRLTPVTLNHNFQDLDSIRINVTVGSAPKIWWMDDLRLGWTNNTCAAGLCRISTPIH